MKRLKGLKGLTLSFGLAALACLPGSALAQISYTFQTVKASGAGFTQLLGINKFGTIAGYRGSGLPGHPNKGFTLVLPNTFTEENFPGSVQARSLASTTTALPTPPDFTSTAAGPTTAS